MNPHVSIITLGVRDFARARAFYVERLGWPVDQEDHNWVCVLLGGGSTAFTLYPWDALAEDARVSPNGDGFRGVTIAYNVRSEERVEARQQIFTHARVHRVHLLGTVEDDGAHVAAGRPLDEQMAIRHAMTPRARRPRTSSRV